jgi:hypothetical protein
VNSVARAVAELFGADCGGVVPGGAAERAGGFAGGSDDGAAECGPLIPPLVTTTETVASRVTTPKSAQKTRVLVNRRRRLEGATAWRGLPVRLMFSFSSRGPTTCQSMLFIFR